MRNIGDKVFVTADNYGSECVVVAIRDADGPMASHYKVRSATDEFWAMDYEVSDMFDSTADTREHIDKVRSRIGTVVLLLQGRAFAHDASKLIEPEKSAYDSLMEFKSSHDMVYGSPDYAEGLKILGPALDHHYAANSHHPQHWPQEETDEMRQFKRQIARYEDIAPRSGKLKQARKELAILESGINGMSLLDLLEMLCDWKAAGERYKDGNITQSLAHNRERFGLSDQLFAILENTVKELGW